MSLYYAIKQIYPDIQDDEFVLALDGPPEEHEPYIHEWRSARPQPTPEQLASVKDAAIAAQDKFVQDSNSLRQNVMTSASGAVGKTYTTLTAAEVRSILALMAWKAGALNPDGTVKPLDQWV